MKAIRIFPYIVLSVAVLTAAGCHRKGLPEGVMDQPTMVSFLERAYLLEGFYAIETGFMYDSLHAEMVASYDSLLTEYGITREDFERSVRYYCEHPHEYDLIHKQVIAHLDSAIAVGQKR